MWCSVKRGEEGSVWVVQSLELKPVGLVRQVLLVGANPAVQEDGWESAVQQIRDARPALDVAWRTNDPGDNRQPAIG